MLIWARWLEPYGNSSIYWSAEPLCHLTNVDEDTLEIMLQETRVWPWPQSSTSNIERQKAEILQSLGFEEFTHQENWELLEPTDEQPRNPTRDIL